VKLKREKKKQKKRTAEAAPVMRQAEDQARNKAAMDMAEDRVAAAAERILSGDATDIECALFLMLVRLTSLTGAADVQVQLLLQRLPDPNRPAGLARLIQPGGS
jgi:hypothetical protein